MKKERERNKKDIEETKRIYKELIRTIQRIKKGKMIGIGIVIKYNVNGNFFDA